MESWRKVWRDGIVEKLSLEALLALRKGLAEDDPRILQGATTQPPPLIAVLDWPCEAGCPLAYCELATSEGATVGECEAFFARMAFDADRALGELGAIRWFLNWADETPRDEMRRELLAEVELELSRRGQIVAA